MYFNKEKQSFYRFNNKLPVLMIEKRRNIIHKGAKEI